MRGYYWVNRGKTKVGWVSDQPIADVWLIKSAISGFRLSMTKRRNQGKQENKEEKVKQGFGETL
jgi:hypothetical protein